MFVSKNRRVPSSLPIALRTAIALATVAVPPVFAADVDVEEILVTATRVTTTLQDTPAAISVVTGDVIRAGGVRNITDMQYEVPSLSVGHQFGVNRTFIRGIGPWQHRAWCRRVSRVSRRWSACGASRCPVEYLLRH
jgi:outer membrane receptor protein involved in Fe transport